MAETIHVKGEGGMVFAMDLPLPEAIADRLAAGQLVRVNADGSPLGSARRPAPAQEEGTALTTGAVPRPPKTATRPAWTAWAQAVHGLTEAQAADMTKAQLMDLPDTPPTPTPVEEQEQEDTPPAPAANGRPAEDAPKSEWIDYAAKQGKGTREDLAVFTREDLIELTA